MSGISEHSGSSRSVLLTDEEAEVQGRISLPQSAFLQTLLCQETLYRPASISASIC